MSVGSHPPLVLVPGLVCDDTVWRHQTRYLTDIAEPRVVEPHGQSTMQELARQILDDLPDRFALAGFSMGGYVALEILRQSPERVDRLALLDTSARPDPPERAERRRSAIAACERGDYEEVIEGMMPILLCDRCRGGPLPDLVRTMTARIGAETFVQRHLAMLSRNDSRELLAASDVPVRVIFGREDGMSTLEEHREMADLAPRGKLSIIEECGHMSPIEQPQAVTSLMRDWLEYD